MGKIEPEIKDNKNIEKPKKEKVKTSILFNHIKPYFFTKSSKGLLGYSLVLTVMSKGLVSMV
jgi:hypothetical protein